MGSWRYINSYFHWIKIPNIPVLGKYRSKNFCYGEPRRYHQLSFIKVCWLGGTLTNFYSKFAVGSKLFSMAKLMSPCRYKNNTSYQHFLGLYGLNPGPILAQIVLLPRICNHSHSNNIIKNCIQYTHLK